MSEDATKPEATKEKPLEGFETRTVMPPRPRPVQLLRHDGLPIEVIGETDQLCSTCNPASGGATLKVQQQTGNTMMLVCLHCGSEERVPRGYVQFRPVDPTTSQGRAR
jgi:hypothetical protein